MMIKYIFPKHQVNIPLALSQLIVLVLISKFLLNSNTSYTDIFVCILTSVILEHVFLWFKYKKLKYFSITSLNTAMSTMIMMSSTNSLLYIPLLFIGIGQKFLLRINDVHFHNPSNVVILLGLLLFPNQMRLNLLSLGEYWWIAPILIASSLIITTKAKLVHMLPAFALTFIPLFPMITGRGIETMIPLLVSVNFILFTAYMQTDPKTIPNTQVFQLLHSLFTVAMIIWVYQLTKRTDIMFFAGLFVAQMFVPLWRWLEVITDTSPTSTHKA